MSQTYERGGYYRVPGGDGGYYEYIGKFKSIKEVPNIRCCYVIGNEVEIYGVKVIIGRMLYINNGPPPKVATAVKRRIRKDTSRSLNVPITKYDNDLMVITKKVVAQMTLKEFKAMYPNDSEMNNVRRILEYDVNDEKDRNKGNLTWQRAIDIWDRAGYGYDLAIYDKKSKQPIDLNDRPDTEARKCAEDEELIDIL